MRTGAVTPGPPNNLPGSLAEQREAEEREGDAPARQEILDHLQRVLAHALFLKTRRLSRFLCLVVESELAGEGNRLKEYFIGVEVFGKPESYNPQEDPVVRIMAGRLRAKLAEFYLMESGERIRIELPRGGYVPRWTRRRAGSSTHTPQVPIAAVARYRTFRAASVGREEELRRLRSALSSAITSGAAVLTICGDAGIGKTTIVEEFLAEIENGGQEIAIGRGRCSERLARTEAFVPVLESLETLLRGKYGETAAGILQRAAPSWNTRLAPAGLNGKKARTQDVTQERMHREFAGFLDELSRVQPVVLFLDDMHWSDPSTCDLIAHVGRRAPTLRTLILMTYRSGPVIARPHPFLPLKLDLEGRGMSGELSLTLLRKPDIERYIALQFPSNSFPPEFAMLVYERTEGHPLFMTDMLRFLRDRGSLAPDDQENWRLDQPIEELRKVIPAGVRNLVRFEIGQLSEESRDILLCGAVQGLEFDSAVVARVLGLDPAGVEERLQDLETERKFVCSLGEMELSDSTLSVRYRFLHVFYQHTLYDLLSPSRRVAYCQRAAQCLVELSGGNKRGAAAEVALLFEAGRDHASAARYFYMAAREAARCFAYPETAALAKHGLNALHRIPEFAERSSLELRFSILLGLASMASYGYASTEAEEAHRRARELCLQMNERARLCSVLWSLHTCHINRGDMLEALQVAREMDALAQSSGDAGEMLVSRHAMGTTMAFMGRLQEGRRFLEASVGESRTGVRLPGKVTIIDPWVTSLSMLARVLTFLGHTDLAVRRAEESLELANRLAHTPSIAYATFWVGWTRQTLGYLEASCGPLECSMELGQEHRLPLILEWGRVLRGAALAGLGRTEEGCIAIRQSMEGQDRMASMLERPYCLTLLAEASCRNGRAKEAVELCDEALLLGQRKEAQCYEPETHRIRGESLLRLEGGSKLPEARWEFERALELAGKTESLLLKLRAAISYFALCRRTNDGRGRSVLAEVAGRFTEEAEVPAVQLARKLLGVPDC